MISKTFTHCRHSKNIPNYMDLYNIMYHIFLIILELGCRYCVHNTPFPISFKLVRAIIKNDKILYFHLDRKTFIPT